jgi:cold shock CspA family protein
MPTSTYTFNINKTAEPLVKDDKLTFKLILSGSSSSNFTASLSQGNLTIGSVAASTGYATTNCPYLDSASISTGSNNNEIIFSSGVSSFYGGGYLFTPNPLSGSVNSLYDTYGDVDYPFEAKLYDIVILYLSDGTYIEYRVLDVNNDSNLLRITLDQTLSQTIKDELALNKFKRFLLLSRREDESNAYIVYQKRPGKTSYGFIIPNNLAPDVLANIDTITKEVKQKLINEQSVIDNISGGTF